MITPDAFFLNSHRKIYKAMIELDSNGKPMDLVTLLNELKRLNQVDEVGGIAYIGSLIDGVPRTDSIKYYVEILQEKFSKRQLINSIKAIEAELAEDQTPFSEVLEKAEKAVFELSKTNQKGRGPRLVGEVAAQLADFYEAKAGDPSKLIGLSTGLADVDKITLGLTPGLTLLASRQSHGKTACSINIACNVARKAGSVYFLSLESRAESIVQRILASESRVNSYRMRQGSMNREEWARFTDALLQLSVFTKFVVDDTADISVSELRSRLRQHKIDFGLDLVVVDYIQLMARILSSKSHIELRHSVSQISTSLIEISRELGVPVLALAQLRRASDDRPDHRPQLSDLAESADLERDADIVLLLYREEMYGATEENYGLATIIPAKQRDGATDRDIELVFSKEFTRFDDLAPGYRKSQEEKETARRAKFTGGRYSSRTNN